MNSKRLFSIVGDSVLTDVIVTIPHFYYQSNLCTGGAAAAAAIGATVVVGSFCFQTANQTLDKFNLRPLLLFAFFSSADPLFFYSISMRSNFLSSFFFYLLLYLFLSPSKLFFVLWFRTIVSRDIKLGFCLNFRQIGKLHAQCWIRFYRKHIQAVIDDLPIPSTYCYALETFCWFFFFFIFWFAAWILYAMTVYSLNF